MTNLSGNSVSRVWLQDGYIYKVQPKYLCDNEWYALEFLRDTGFVPLAKRFGDETICMEHIVGTLVTDEALFRDNCEAFLGRLFRVGLRHGDLTRPHVFSVGDSPIVIDWAESRWHSDPRPDKRPEGDIYWLWRTVEEIIAENNL